MNKTHNIKQYRTNYYSKNKKRISETHKEYYNKKGYNRDKYLKRMYNISLEEYNKLLLKQNNCCAICGRSQFEIKKKFAVDHDHKHCLGKKSCGKCIRGLLCSFCNRYVGIISMDLSLFESSLNYLKRTEQNTGI